ncbi:hypothetical protein GGE35_002874 [Rhizobium cellulosilyticum]|uniref:Uncharacterized protein n=1 Tax=Aliirhizobium cellulosilyticum TaxID=393664 RepID=A0A7W6XB73_9HYPH|nr:hypothetical protein [Rhizobium cellulosilyticum]MBB4412420.1 hypothetical protein [Rhizobium cellulosilyticum]MBB4447052.1 hypothetical protein [Rhizobium cellulosilyticum]
MHAGASDFLTHLFRDDGLLGAVKLRLLVTPKVGKSYIAGDPVRSLHSTLMRRGQPSSEAPATFIKRVTASHKRRLRCLACARRHARGLLAIYA